ncbi:hypothetical protein K239x_12820 [Planctomycetes bacterium K23_9]|uniref:Uncharacterized protein n=1 Tax=Stieleria marina TaxID=1930275 RepID=A0A517NQD2_9BACT|nr:hypothetical protein K239x_12820 [Planctomycetes bacterium K23_9]
MEGEVVAYSSESAKPRFAAGWMMMCVTLAILGAVPGIGLMWFLLRR